MAGLLAKPDGFSRSTAFHMYILYLDESGAHSEASYFVLAGLAVFERESTGSPKTWRNFSESISRARRNLCSFTPAYLE